jgi:hypothetical protein
MGKGNWNGFSIVSIRSWSNHQKRGFEFGCNICKVRAETPKSLSLLSQYESDRHPSELSSITYPHPPTRDYRSDNETRWFLTSWPVQSLISTYLFDLQETGVARAAVISGGLSTSSSVGRDSIFAPRVRCRFGLPWTIFRHPRLRRALRSMLLRNLHSRTHRPLTIAI